MWHGSELEDHARVGSGEGSLSLIELGAQPGDGLFGALLREATHAHGQGLALQLR